MGPVGYVRDHYNVFDGVLAWISMLDVALTQLALPGMSALRVFRLFRLLVAAPAVSRFAIPSGLFFRFLPCSVAPPPGSSTLLWPVPQAGRRGQRGWPCRPSS